MGCKMQSSNDDSSFFKELYLKPFYQNQRQTMLRKKSLVYLVYLISSISPRILSLALGGGS